MPEDKYERHSASARQYTESGMLTSEGGTQLFIFSVLVKKCFDSCMLASLCPYLPLWKYSTGRSLINEKWNRIKDLTTLKEYIPLWKYSTGRSLINEKWSRMKDLTTLKEYIRKYPAIFSIALGHLPMVTTTSSHITIQDINGSFFYFDVRLVSRVYY